MHIKPNINILNSLIRITIGFTILSWSTAKLVKRPWRDSYLIMAILGAMKVAEGIVRYCPLTDLYERCAIPKKWLKYEPENNPNLDGEEMLPYNPI
jgi:hypothetical protein